MIEETNSLMSTFVGLGVIGVAAGAIIAPSALKMRYSVYRAYTFMLRANDSHKEQALKSQDIRQRVESKTDYVFFSQQ